MKTLSRWSCVPADSQEQYTAEVMSLQSFAALSRKVIGDRGHNSQGNEEDPPLIPTKPDHDPAKCYKFYVNDGETSMLKLIWKASDKNESRTWSSWSCFSMAQLMGHSLDTSFNSLWWPRLLSRKEEHWSGVQVRESFLWFLFLVFFFFFLWRVYRYSDEYLGNAVIYIYIYNNIRFFKASIKQWIAF